MRRVLALVAVATTLLGIVIACGTSPVFVGTLGCEISDAGDNRHVCLADQFCVASSCGSTAGQCEEIDTDGCASSGYECGCDGVTYYNACAREEAHETLATKGPCAGQNARTCGLSEECPGGGRCAAIFSIPQFDPRNPLSFVDASGGLGPFDPSAVLGFPDASAARGLPDASAILALLDGGNRETACALLTAFTPRICWSLPEAGTSMGSRKVWNLCTECEPDLAAIRSEGVYYTCPSPDASAD